MSQPRDDRQDDLFRPPLEEIINLRHPLVRLAGKIDWNFLAGRFRSVCRVGPGQPPLPTRLVAGLLILKHMHNLSDEALCDRWVENPYFQYFCGEVVFRHELPFDRSSLTRWRQRLGEEQIAALLQESLSVAHRIGAIDTKDLERVAIDTTVQEKAIAHPTDARLTHRAIEKLVELAKREGVELRQSYLRLAKRAAIMVGRYTHAHQFKRARRELKFLRTRLGRIIRDIRRKIEGNTALEDRFGPLLDLALRVRYQEQRQRGPKVYSLHAPEVECIGRGKARAPYEFGCKVSIATPVTAPARANSARWRPRGCAAAHPCKRRALGMRPQSESLSATQPWRELGMSRAAWYRRNKARGDSETTLSAAIFLSSEDRPVSPEGGAGLAERGFASKKVRGYPSSQRATTLVADRHEALPQELRLLALGLIPSISGENFRAAA